MDNFGAALYGSRKYLMYKAKQQCACFFSSVPQAEAGLSRPTLDNLVDNSAQALYERAKWLICKDIA